MSVCARLRTTTTTVVDQFIKMEYVCDAFDDPRDAIVLSFVVPERVHTRRELIANFDDDHAKLVLMRTPDWTKLTLYNPVACGIPWIGQRLRHLDMRLNDPTNLMFCEFLPEIEDLRVSAPSFSGGIRARMPTLKHLKLCSGSMFGLFAETRTLLPALVTMDIYASILYASHGMRFPEKIRTLHLNGILMTQVIDALETCPAVNVTLTCAGLMDVPELPPHVERLDLSHNLIDSFGPDIFPNLTYLSVQNNFMFDCTTIVSESLRTLDRRGTCGWPWELKNARTIVSDADPPSYIKISCPKLERVLVKYVDRVGHAWHLAHRLAGCRATDACREEGELCEEDVEEFWTSYIDDVPVVHILPNPRTYDDYNV